MRETNTTLTWLASTVKRHGFHSNVPNRYRPNVSNTRIAPCSIPAASIQDEQVQCAGPSRQRMLFAVEQKGLGRARKTTDLRIPEAFASRCIPSFHVRAIAEEQQSTGG